uniref:Golgin subfamily A member 7 n=3 Tax=Caniformia TaxID=379584 RepID=A0A8C0NJC3_CANLF
LPWPRPAPARPGPASSFRIDAPGRGGAGRGEGRSRPGPRPLRLLTAARSLTRVALRPGRKVSPLLAIEAERRGGETSSFAAGRKWRCGRCDCSWRAEEAGSCFPGRTGLRGVRGLAPGYSSSPAGPVWRAGPVLAMRPQQAPVSGKVFIQRDYSSGTRCQFQTKFPAELENRIDRQQFEETVRTLNNLYAEAEKLGGQSYLEGCLACLTAYTIFLCMETHYEKVLKKVSKYIQEQNEKIYAPQGLLLTDPIERGLRVVSFLPRS